MFDRLRNRLDAGRQDGFTLIELLIVIVILGVLAGIVVFAVGGITDRGKKSACEADRKTVETAVEAYYAQNSKYPTDYTGDDPPLVPNFLRSAPSATYANDGYQIALAASGGGVTATKGANAASATAGCPA